jgi:glycosyltransferase involved in cell wall biosynthesis
MNISVIIPAFNEQDAIGHVVRAIPPAGVQEIIVADNGSTDTTAAAARAAGARVIHEPRRGYGYACLAGIAAAAAPDIIVFLDGDYSDVPDEMPALVQPILNGQADFVLGSRIAGPDGRRVLPRHACLGNMLVTRVIQLLFGFRYTDLGPFRAIRSDALRRLDMRDVNFGWTVEMQIKALQKGLAICEVPVRYRPRIGRSKVSGTLWGSIRAGVKILYCIVRLRLSPAG